MRLASPWRLERQDHRVVGSFSTDGRSWEQLEPWPFDSRKARVGVAAVNTSSTPFRAKFEDFKLLGR
jgi:regulation of enolase protein 1 (concanavalin A-like superfamily)